MNEAEAITAAHDEVERAIGAKDWEAADRGLQHLAGTWLRGMATVDGSVLEQAAARMQKLRIRTVARNDVDQRVGAPQIAWMLATTSSFLTQGIRPATPTARDTDGLILECLVLAPGPMTTSQIVERTGRSKFTVARRLPVLRAEGLVNAYSVSSHKYNEITEAGRRRYEEMGEMPPQLWPTTIDRVHERPEASITFEDLAFDRIGSPINDARSVLAIV